MGFVPFTFIDLIDILFVAYIMYWIYRTTKGTNAPYIISGWKTTISAMAPTLMMCPRIVDSSSMLSVLTITHNR